MRTPLLYSSVFLLTCALTGCRAPVVTAAAPVQPPSASLPLGIVSVQVSGLGDSTPLVQTSFTPSSRTLSAQSFTPYNPNMAGNTV